MKDASSPAKPNARPEKPPIHLPRGTRRPCLEEQYPAWVRNNELRATDVARLRVEASRLVHRPPVSLLLAVRNPDHRRLKRALDSVMSQVYPRWELLVRATGPIPEPAKKTLKLYERLDGRVRVERPAENPVADGRAPFGGEYVGRLGQDDALEPDALFRVVELLQKHRDADLVYSDDDRIDDAGNRSNPHFKPGWSPDFLMSYNYLSRLCVYRRRLLDEVGDFGEGGDDGDHDLALRFTEKTREVRHVPRVLYHHGGTAADGTCETVREASRRAVARALGRRGVEGSVEDGLVPYAFRVKHSISGTPKVGIIIPTRDNASLLENCVRSIGRRTAYRNYEVLIVDNQNTSPDAVRYLASTPHRVIPFDEAFNFSRLNNLAVSHTNAEYLLFLNDDTEAVSDGWLEAMLRHAQRPEVGAVGSKLVYPDGRVQHAGALVGVGNPWGPGVAVHAHQYYPSDSEGHGGSLAVDRNYTAVTAACMMLRRKVFEEVGGFEEENLRVSFNDVDLCMKMRERGYLIVYTPYAELIHHESASRGHGSNPEEALYMRERWGAALDRDPYYNPNLSSGAGDYRLRADMLRPRALRLPKEEPGKHPQEMDRDELKRYMSARQARIRSSHKTGLVPVGPRKPSAPPNTRPSRPAGPSGSPKRPEPATFFIIGQPKSGTSWVRATLDSHPEIACLGEGKFFGRDFKTANPSSGGKLPSLHSLFADSEDLKTWARAVGPWISRRNDPRTRQEALERHVRGLARAAISYFLEDERARSGKPIVGDKTPAHTAYLPEMHDLFTDARVIHVIRDGRDQAVSSLFHWWKESDKAAFSKLPPEVFDRRDAYRENPHEFGPGKQSIFDEDVLRGLARGWRENVSQARKLGPKLFGDQYFELKYEDLLERPEDLFAEVAGFLGADHDRELIAGCVRKNDFGRMTGGRQRGVEDPGSFFRKGVAGDWENHFTGRDRRIYEEEAGDLLEALGYR